LGTNGPIRVHFTAINCPDPLRRNWSGLFQEALTRREADQRGIKATTLKGEPAHRVTGIIKGLTKQVGSHEVFTSKNSIQAE
jgi:hypothetical protein